MTLCPFIYCPAVFKDFKEHKQFRPPFAAEGIFGGALLAVRSNDFVDFYEWEDMRLVRRIGTRLEVLNC